MAPAAVGRYVRAVRSNLRIPPLRFCLDAVRARARHFRGRRGMDRGRLILAASRLDTLPYRPW